MKTFSPAMTSYLADNRVLQLFNCWKIQLNDGRVLGFTDFNYSVRFDEEPTVVYEASTGFNKTAVQQSGGFGISNSHIDSYFDSAQINEVDFLKGLWEGAKYYEFQFTPDLSTGKEWDATLKREIFKQSMVDIIKEKSGQVGNFNVKNKIFEAELRGLNSIYDINIGRTFQPLCSLTLGSPKCGVDLSPFTYNGAITSVISRTIFKNINLQQAPAFFSYGKLIWLTGANEKVIKDVKRSDETGIVEFKEPVPYDMQVGDTYTIIAGCDKKQATCIAKFNNHPKFNGFPNMPGVDALGRGIIKLKKS